MNFRPIVESISKTSRSLRRAPGFVAIAALSLGAALGLSTSVFALIDSMTHPNSPFRHVEQLYSVFVYGKVKTPPSPREIRDDLLALPGVESLASATSTSLDVEAGETIANTWVSYTSPNFFDVLGVQARVGRLPSPDEGRLQRVALVSDDFWKMRYRNRSATGDAHLTIAGHVYSIIGVLPARAKASLSEVAVWIPQPEPEAGLRDPEGHLDRKSTRLKSSHA